MNSDGICHEETLSLPVSAEIAWEDFICLFDVKNLLLEHPTMWLQDVTPDGMPDRFTDEQHLRNQLEHQGIRKTFNNQGAPRYEEVDNTTDDLPDLSLCESTDDTGELLQSE